jgi:hypothetical protein
MSGQPNDLRPFGARLPPLIDRLSAKEVGSLADLHRQADFKSAPSNPHVVAASLVLRRFVNEYRQSSCWHFVHSPRLDTSERVGIRADNLNSFKRLTVVTVPFLPTARFTRRAAEPFRWNAREMRAA